MSIITHYSLVVVSSHVYLALGLLVASITCAPGGNFFTSAAAKIGLGYYAISIFLNTTLTCMICYRIMRHARKIQEHVGHEYASLYFTIITIVVESVFPYTLCGIAFLVSLGIGSSTSVAFICVYLLMMVRGLRLPAADGAGKAKSDAPQCISPQILILRVIVGRALDKDTFKQTASTIKFSPGTTTRSQLFDGSEARVQLQTLSNVYLPDGHDKV